MVEFTTGDGVRKAKIDYYTPGAWTFKVSLKKWCGDDQDLWRPCIIIQIVIQIHKTVSTRPTPWKKVGASYVITDIGQQQKNR